MRNIEELQIASNLWTTPSYPPPHLSRRQHDINAIWLHDLPVEVGKHPATREAQRKTEMHSDPCIACLRRHCGKAAALRLVWPKDKVDSRPVCVGAWNANLQVQTLMGNTVLSGNSECCFVERFRQLEKSHSIAV